MAAPKHILFATDLSETSDSGLQLACDWSVALDAELSLVHVIGELRGEGILLSIAADGTVRHPIVDELARALADRPATLRLGAQVVAQGGIVRGILEAVEQLRPDLLVLGAHGGGVMARALAGSLTAELVRKAPCPLLVAPNAAASGPSERVRTVRVPGTILVAVDLEEPSAAVIDYAVALAARIDAHVHVLHACEPIPRSPFSVPAVAAFDELHASALKELDRHIEPYRNGKVLGKCIAAAGIARFIILESARELGAELIVLGSRERRGLPRALLGSVTESVLRHAACPVLIVKPIAGRDADD